MTTRPRCNTCAAYNALESTCQRHAPSPLPQQHSPTELKIHGIFPGTNASRWCLDHVPAPTDENLNAPIVGTSSVAVR